MSSKKVLVTVPMGDEWKTWLQEKTNDCEDSYEFRFENSNDVPLELVKEADIIFGNPSALSVSQNDHLGWIQLHSAGFEQYLLDGILNKDCILTNARGAYGLALSEHMLAMTFSLMRRFTTYERQQLKHYWKTSGEVKSVEGSVCVVLGMGDIGCDYARKMKACGAYIIGVRKNPNEKPEFFDEQVLISEIDTVLPRADFFAMAIPGGEENKHILDERRMRLMKDDAIIVNAGRGNAIDSAALKKVLSEGKFFGVGLDVTEPEPLTEDDELWDYERVLITPHAAGGFLLPETKNRIIRIAGDNLYAYTHGEKMKNVIEH